MSKDVARDAVGDMTRGGGGCLDAFFHPSSIAIVGAGQNFFKPNGLTIGLLFMFGYKGDVYPVNPKYDNVAGFKCYPSVVDIAVPVDLAVITLRADLVMDRLKECAEKGIKSVIIFSSGFSEIGDEGKRVQDEILSYAKGAGIRLLGPNCLGINNYRDGSMASFFYHKKEKLTFPHFLSFITQSGGIGWIIYQLIMQAAVGFNYFVSTGNEADIKFSDVLDYLVDKDDVKMVGGYLEGLYGGGQRFMDACERAVLKGKLVSILKVGKTEAGAKAASSHTGSIVGEDQVYDAVFRQKGVVRVENAEEMSAMANILATERVPKGNGLGIITISGGGGVLVADKAPGYGLDVVALGDETQGALREFFPIFGATGNPVDLTSKIMMVPDLFQKTIKLVMDDPKVDIGVFFYNIDVPNPESNAKIIEVYNQIKKPLVIFTFPTKDPYGLKAMEELVKAGIPVVENISAGLFAISALLEWRKLVEGYEAYDEAKRLSVLSDGQKAEIEAVLQDSTVLTESRAKAILRDYGVPVTAEFLAKSIDEALGFADDIGYPVVLKVESPDILHKTEAEAVVLDVRSPEELRVAYGRIMENVKAYMPGARIDGILVQEMLEPGLEVILGVKNDAIFGPMVVFGLGGIFVEVLKDFSMKAAPVNRVDAEKMVDEVKGAAVLKGVRGKKAYDRAALVETIMRLSEFAADYAGFIDELDINPLIVYEEGCGVRAADALILGKVAE